jgi:hypothetical protein
MLKTFNSIDLKGVKRNYEIFTALPFFATQLFSLSYLTQLGLGKFDFADDMSYKVYNSDNMNQPTIKKVFSDYCVGGFIKFENSNDLYNVYDAGNFLTGKAFSQIGVGKTKAKLGAQANSLRSLSPDSDADQRAISKGYDYPTDFLKK